MNKYDNMPELKFKSKVEILRESIRNDILNGKYLPGDKLPPEEKYARFYDVNRGTVNRALSSIEAEGLISRKPKIGSIVLDMAERSPALRLAGLMMVGTGHLYGKLHSMMTEQMQKNNYYPVTLNINPESSIKDIRTGMADYLKSFLDISPDFLAVDGMYDIPMHLLKKALKKTTKLIFFNRFESDINFDASYILSDYFAGGTMVTEHLLKTGCDDVVFAYASLSQGTFTNTHKMLDGIRHVYNHNGKKFPDSNIFHLNSEGSLEKLIEKVRKSKSSTGIFASYDNKARIIESELKKHGLTAGRDYKLAGYFNTPWAYEFEPGLTSVSINEEAIAAEFCRMLKTHNKNVEKVMIKPELIIRETA